MISYHGSCHCGAVSYDFIGPEIDQGVRCNCSICARKGAVMTAFVVVPADVSIQVKEDALSTYQFATEVAKHHFCNRCGIYTFHQTLRKPGHYRFNAACIEGVNALELPIEIFDGASL